MHQTSKNLKLQLSSRCVEGGEGGVGVGVEGRVRRGALMSQQGASLGLDVGVGGSGMLLSCKGGGSE